MKKFFTLTMLLVAAIAVNAQNRTWDFTNWSATTKAALTADDDTNGGERWTSVEKKDGSGETDDNCFWWNMTGAAELTTMADGSNAVAIAETAGLTFECAQRSLALAINYQTAWDGMGPYAGPSYLWIGGSSNKITIPSVKKGSKITMEVESHKPSEGRGMSLSVNGTKIQIESGSETPKEKTTCTWIIPTDIATEDKVDVVATNSKGCHIYTISVNEDAPAVDGAKIAFFYDSSYPNYTLDADVSYQMLANNEFFSNTTVEGIDVTKDMSAIDRDSLCKFSIVVISGAISADNAFANTLKQAIAYTPILNLGTNLYKTWGLGNAVATSTAALTVSESNRTHSLFIPQTQNEELIDENGNLPMLTEGTLSGVAFDEGSYFAADEVIATADGNTAIHIHNAARNAYMLLPYGDKTGLAEATMYDILTNAATLLNNSKQSVPTAGAPAFTEIYNNLNTDVKVTSSTSNAKIYYTVVAPGNEATDPSAESTPYTGPVNITEAGSIISAIAYADGYNPSEITRDTVETFVTSASPEVQVAYEEGKTTVTLVNKEEGATVYYSINGSLTPIECGVYTEPFTVSHHVTLTAFAGEVEGKKQSEPVVKEINVTGEKIRIDEMASFDANKADWACGESKVKYYTDGKKNGYNFYEVEESTVTGSEGQDSTVYTIIGPANKVSAHNPGNGWIAKSFGQGMLWERLTVNADIDNTNEAGRYRAETAFDVGATDDCISFGNVRKSDGANNDPYSGSLYSTQKFQGPFDIVTWVGNASSSNIPKAEIYVSTDTLDEANWVKVDTLVFAKTQRWIKKNIVSYEGTDEVFVKLQPQFSSVQVYNIKIMYAGEKSEEYVTGIEDVNTGSAAAGNVVRTVVYNINGTQIAKPAKGINIIREVYANGQSKTRKVVVR